MAAIWVPCPDCDDYWCLKHKRHVYACQCLCIEHWSKSPYV